MRFNKIVSYLFHPIFLATLTAILYFYFTPKYFDIKIKYRISIVIFLSTVIIPVIFLSVLKKKDTISDFHLSKIKERKYPLLFFSILYFLLGLRLLNLNLIDIVAYTCLSVSISLTIAYLLLFKKYKISLHTIGIGIIIGFLINFNYLFEISLIFLISIFFILFGIVANARLKLKAHTQSEVYIGFILGLLLELCILFIYKM